MVEFCFVFGVYCEEWVVFFDFFFDFDVEFDFSFFVFRCFSGFCYGSYCFVVYCCDVIVCGGGEGVGFVVDGYFFGFDVWVFVLGFDDFFYFFLGFVVFEDFFGYFFVSFGGCNVIYFKEYFG